MQEQREEAATNAAAGGRCVNRPARPPLPGFGRNWRTVRNGVVVLFAIAMVASVGAFYTMQALRAQQTDADKIDAHIYWEQVTAFLSLCCSAGFAFSGMLAWYVDCLRHNFNSPPQATPVGPPANV